MRAINRQIMMKRGAIKVSNFNSAATSWTIIHGRCQKTLAAFARERAAARTEIHTEP